MIVQEDAGEAYLRTIGNRVRELRARRGMSRRILARDSGVSERYLAQLESGQGNASILVVRALARAFGVAPETLVAEARALVRRGRNHRRGASASPERLAAVAAFLASPAAGTDAAARTRRIALIGLRGAGKSTLGPMLAQERGVPFLELDREVERDAGVNLATIFDFSGQAGYRRYERAALERVLQSEAGFVLAAGGSIVSEAPTFERLLACCFTVWLSALPADHMARVVAQGDMRPMAGHREAMNDLRGILAGREGLYRRADAEISTSGRPVEASLKALIAATPAHGG